MRGSRLLPLALLLLTVLPVHALRGEAAKTKKGGAAAAEAPKWDVNHPPGPASEVAIDVDEGTWMNVDVAPDGKEIAFDLLGDLYTIPIAGGEAHALTHDVAWQMQPRYSPDGKTIVYTSDQGGGDNLWLMDRDGSHVRALTKESFRLLNSPTWSPDGEYVVGRKHYNNTRSLGAGEMWMYHRTGGDGLELTKKRNDEKDSGEPAFSRDGRYLFYSEDTTPGGVFQYNKDVNGQIYVIQRLDLHTGEVIPFVTGAGGAIRPTPSPDGKRLAFVRRVRAKSVIYLMDLRSGESWPVYDGLDRDMQETWAIHGVYPTMSWMPDGRSLVFWAGGKIRRLDLESGQAAVIPFHVRSTRQVTKAVRFPVSVAPDRFDVKMLRWVTVAPHGDSVVYQALGKLWTKTLPDGAPRRLTSQERDIELYPAFSRDGRWIVYTTWNDRDLGTVRIVAAGGGEGRTISDVPGHYVEPTFTPDGAQVVYRRTTGGFLRSAAWSLDPGIYRMPAAGGAAAVLVTKDGANPSFGAAGDRLYLFDGGDDGLQAKLLSVGLDGREPRTEVTAEKATELAVSPDGRWIAWSTGFNAYVAPFAPAARAVELGPATKSVPVAKVTHDSGENLQWSGDSQSLHWSLGPTLYTRELKDSFSFLAGAPAQLPEPPAKGVAIGFSAASDKPTGTVAVVGARVITMHGDEVIEDGTVVVDGNRIRAVGRRADVKVPDGAYVIDAAGKTVMPGIIDVHWHGGMGSEGILPQQSWINAASLAFGVTTLHDPSNDTDMVFAASELAKAGLIVSPRIFSTGTILYGAAAPFKADIDSLDDARFHLRRMQAVGAFSVKSYSQPRRDQRQQVIAAARELGMMVVPEGGSLLEHNLTMVVDGHTSVEHSLPVAHVYADVKQLWGGTEVGYTPTLGVAYGGLFGETWWYDKTHVWEDARLQAFVPREVLDPRARRRTTAPDEEYNHFAAARNAHDLAAAGVKVDLGAHGQREGLAAHWEMAMLVQGGMTPQEALRCATVNGAHLLGLDHDLGSLEAGKLADLVILDANPYDDIRNTTKIHWVMKNGRVYDGMTLDEQGNHPAKHQPFFWQLPHPAWSANSAGRALADD